MKTERFKRVLLLPLIIASLIALTTLLLSPSLVHALTSHDPIHINGNAAFTPANGVVAGDGTSGNPYIIEDWEIDALGGTGIWIQNTDAYFEIRNCRVYNGYRGIRFTNVTNGKIINVTSEGNGDGILLDLGSTNNTIQNCTVSNNSYLGIWISHSANNTLRNNILSNNRYAFGVWSYDDLDEFVQDIDTTNVIDGKPIYYVVGQSRLTFDGSVMDIGYLGLISSERIKVKNLNIQNVFHGILLANTSRTKVEDSTFSNTYWGIDLNASQRNKFINCTTSQNVTGIGLYSSTATGFSDRNKIMQCTIKNNSRDGIQTWPLSSNNRIFHNNFIANGIYQAFDPGSNYWDDGYPSGGNYWDDFDEPSEGAYDSNNDGIVDSPYNIPGGTNQDRYPLKNPI